MAKPSAMTMVMTITMIVIASTLTHALIPYTTRSIFDAMFPPELDDPFRILEHSASPLSILSRPTQTHDDGHALILARANWRELPSAHEISLDVPGMKRDDVKIEIDEESRVLRVSGERKTEEEVKDERWHRMERTVGKFTRQFRMPRDADVDRVGASMEDGVLRIVVPKLEEKDLKKKEAKVVSIEEKSGSTKVGGENVLKTNNNKQEL